MSIYGNKKILAVGKGTDLYEFIKAFKAAGIEVVREERISTALTTAKEFKPDTILFVLPRYWTEITGFVEKIRDMEGFERTPIIYIGAMIEGTDQQVLKERGVVTMTLGPVPVKEMARHVIDEMSKLRF